MEDTPTTTKMEAEAVPPSDTTSTEHEPPPLPTTPDGQEPEEERDEDDYQVDYDAMPPRKRLQRSQRLSIPELLAIRQEYGISSLSLPIFARPRNLMTTTLSAKIAWYVCVYQLLGCYKLPPSPLPSL